MAEKQKKKFLSRVYTLISRGTTLHYLKCTVLKEKRPAKEWECMAYIWGQKFFKSLYKSLKKSRHWTYYTKTLDHLS